MNILKSALSKQEGVLALTILILVTLVSIINPAFFSFINLLFLFKNSVVTAIFAMGFLLILIIGGLDISFAAVGVVAMYVSLRIAIYFDMNMGYISIMMIAMFIGGFLGCINGFLVTRLQVSSLIVTLGTMSLYRGFLLFFIGTEYIRKLPQGVTDFSRSNIFKVTAANGAKVGFHSSLLLVLVIAILVAAILRYTILGRQAYAIGGDRESAFRAGISVRKIEWVFYIAAGILAGIAGLLSASFIRVANPFSIIGSELDVVVATIIGGASISGGKGSVLGTLLGVLLIAVLRNSLTLLHIPSYGHNLAVGFLILVAIAIPALKDKYKPGFSRGRLV